MAIKGSNSTENWRKMLNHNPKSSIVNIIVYVKFDSNPSTLLQDIKQEPIPDGNQGL